MCSCGFWDVGSWGMQACYVEKGSKMTWISRPVSSYCILPGGPVVWEVGKHKRRSHRQKQGKARHSAVRTNLMLVLASGKWRGNVCCHWRHCHCQRTRRGTDKRVKGIKKKEAGKNRQNVPRVKHFVVSCPRNYLASRRPSSSDAVDGPLLQPLQGPCLTPVARPRSPRRPPLPVPWPRCPR